MRNDVAPRSPSRAFTLAELLVVIAIIGLLVAILVPSLHGARTQTKVVATQSLISSLGVSLDQFKQESRLGGYYPPSASDNDGGIAQAPREIADPLVTPPDAPEPQLNHTTGASLLVYALNGADGLGTPGFVDRNNDEKWSDDFGVAPSAPAPYGSHEVDPVTREAKVPRYGPYAKSDPQTKSIHSIGKLLDKGGILEPATSWSSDHTKGDYKHLVFADSFNHPILYYRARRAARAIVTLPSPPTPGVFDHKDNASITGDDGNNGTAIDGLRFVVGPAGAHKLANERREVDAAADPKKLDPASTSFDPNHAQSFERYIWDPKVSGRIAPVNRETFLLISAGPDGIYGNADDVTNFGKN